MATLVVCLDGTNQTWDQPHPSNIVLCFKSLGGTPTLISNGSYETTFPVAAPGTGKYLPGVGTQGDPALKLLGDAFGDGIAEPIVRGYTFLSRAYNPGDRIFITGFSRGATAARALAGFVSGRGLLNRAAYDPSQATGAYLRGIAAWSLYRGQPFSAGVATALDSIAADQGGAMPKLTAADFTPIPPIEAVGVYDTVSSLGVPILGLNGDASFAYTIINTDLSPNVAHGFHALAADETRDLFAPTYWTARAGIEQRVFPGAHSNVGGGYPERGLSDGALKWMMESLSGVGMPYQPALLPLAPNPSDTARDDGETLPFVLTPRHARQFPLSALSDPSIAARRNGPPVIKLPNLTPGPYIPVGGYVGGGAL